MPAQPLPAEGSGEYVIRWKTNRTHVTGTLYRRASTGALVELGTERASLPLAQEALARNGEAPYPDELGYVDSVDELGRIGKRIKKFAKKVATSKLGKLVKTAGSIATAFVPGGSAIQGTIKTAKIAAKGIRAAKSLKARPRPQPIQLPVYYEDPDGAAAGEEVGAVAKKPAAKKPAPKPAAKPKAAPKPAAKKPAAKPAAKPKAAPKPAAKKPASKPAAKPAAKPKVAAKKAPAAPTKPATATARLSEVASSGVSAKQTLIKAAAKAPPAKVAQTAKLAALVGEIEDAAPELAATLATLPDVPEDERDLIEQRAVAAAQKLAQTPADEREEMAQKLEKRLDGYKVVAPDGTTVWVPLEEVG